MGDLEDEGKVRWDRYRTNYPEMTYQEVADDHQWIWDNYPDQSHHSVEQLEAFFAGDQSNVAVLEVGGWRGEAARRILAAHPEMASWTNYEICQSAVTDPATYDPRYWGVWPDRWAWELPPPLADKAVLAHVIEHVSDAQLPLLLKWVRDSGALSVYIEAPIHDAGQGWWGGNTTHLLTVGWDVVITLLHTFGYKVTERIRTVADPALGHGHDAVIARASDG